MTMMNTRSRSDEKGFTLAELLIGMTLAMVVTSLLAAGAVSIYRGHRYTRQDSDSLGALRAAVGRLEKELRQSRKAYPSSTATKLGFWVDYDNDGIQDLSERVTWELVTVGTTANLTRTTAAVGATTAIIARNLVYADAFTYNTGKTLVSISFSADADPDELAPARTVSTDIRLRNSSS
jgi:type II secretory pathway pseudopilin PulG